MFKKILYLIPLLAGLFLFTGCPDGGVSITFYYTITYDANGATSGNVPVDSNYYVYNAPVTIMGNTENLSRTGYTFIGWNISSNPDTTASNYEETHWEEGDLAYITGNTTLYAEWEEETSVTSTRTFRALDISDSTFYDCKADLLAETSHAMVYVEQGSGVSQSTATTIANEFENNIYSTIASAFGTESDVDGNGKIILLYLDIRDGYSGSGGYVGGYFHSYHNYSTSNSGYENSNEADMIFLDTYPSTAGSDSSNETVAHEFQHLINYYQNAMLGGSPQDTWVNEGLSSGAEFVYSGEVSTSRVDYYNTDPNASENPGSSILYGNNFFIWQNELEDYATVSLFFQWLRIHDNEGTGIYKRIMDSTKTDYQAVTEATSTWTSTTYSDFGVWGDLFSTWMAANIRDDASGYLGYKGLVEDQLGNPPSPQGFLSSDNATVSLPPGHRIISAMPDSGINIPGSSGPNIEYLGLSAVGDLDRLSPYTGEVSIVYNSNPDFSGTNETAFVASTESVEPLFSKSYIPEEEIILPESYKMDVPFNSDGTIKE